MDAANPPPSSPNPSPSLYARVKATADALRQDLPPSLRKPKVAIVCGSGLGGLAGTIEEEPRVSVAYENVQGFPRSTVPGHEGRLIFGVLGPQKVPVMLLVGRAHFYEGHTMQLVTYATRVCKMLEVETMIVTNAAGGLNEEFNVGDIVMLSDHVNLPGLTGNNPLLGPNEPLFGPRFPPLSDAYDLSLRRLGHQSWSRFQSQHPSKRKLHEGTYAFVTGPFYETRAECRLLRLLGADVVGMSTVPEILVARHCGMRILALSLVTNNAVLQPGPRGDDPAIQGMGREELGEFLSRGKADHQEVLEAGREAAADVVGLVKEIVADLASAD